MNQDGIWLSILDYAALKKISISTIRRSIKAERIKYKEENGKYFIWTKGAGSENLEGNKGMPATVEIELLKKQNKKLFEEIDDLKMLLTVYEKQHNIQPPPIPEITQ